MYEVIELRRDRMLTLGVQKNQRRLQVLERYLHCDTIHQVALSLYTYAFYPGLLMNGK